MSALSLFCFPEVPEVLSACSRHCGLQPAISCSPDPIAASAVLIEPFAGVCPSIASSSKIQWEVGSLLVCVPSSGDPSLTGQTRPTPPAQTFLGGYLLGVIALTVVC